MAQKIILACGGSVDGKTIAILGLTFKPNTDDMRDAPCLAIIPALLAAGAHVRAYDPEGMRDARLLLPADVTYCTDEYDTMAEADAVVLLTEWNQFRNLDISKMKRLLNESVMIDLRNVYSPIDMANAGFHYTSIGRATLPPVTNVKVATARKMLHSV